MIKWNEWDRLAMAVQMGRDGMGWDLHPILGFYRWVRGVRFVSRECLQQQLENSHIGFIIGTFFLKKCIILNQPMKMMLCGSIYHLVSMYMLWRCPSFFL